MYQIGLLSSKPVLCLQICFQKTVLRRKPSPLTPTPSWPRLYMKIDREFSSSKITQGSQIFAECPLTCRAQHSLTSSACLRMSYRYSHVSPLELDKFLEDVKWVELQLMTHFVSAISLWPQHERPHLFPSSGMGFTHWWISPHLGLTPSPELCPCPRSRLRQSRRRLLNPRRQKPGRLDFQTLDTQSGYVSVLSEVIYSWCFLV